MDLDISMRVGYRIRNRLKNEDNIKNEDDLKNKNNPKNEDDLKNYTLFDNIVQYLTVPDSITTKTRARYKVT